MDALKIEIFSLGSLATNAYLIIRPETRQCVLIDAPDGIEEVTQYILREGLTLLYVILTHAHGDHIGGMPQLDVPFYIHSADVPFLSDPSLNMSSFFEPVTVTRGGNIIEDGGTVPFGPYEFRVLHTPGHTPGSICLLLDKYLFSGDTLFFGSVGRTDLPQGSGDALFSSIREKLLTLAPDTIVFPGHGPETTIGREIARNPFLE